MAHAAMLGALRHPDAQAEAAAAAVTGSPGILSDLESEGTLTNSTPAAEDIHMFVEQTLTERLGDVGRKLHTARSPQRSGGARPAALSASTRSGEITRADVSAALAAITDQAEQ